MQILFIVLAILGLAMVIVPEVTARPQGAALKERLGKQADLIMGIVSSVGMLVLLVGIIGFALDRWVPGVDYSAGLKPNGRESILLFGALQIRYYGIIIVLAMLVAANVAARLAVVDKRNPEHIWGALTWAIIPGIILARLWFITFPPVTSSYTAAYFYGNFFNLEDGGIAIWSGGLNIFGAVLGGFGGAYIYFIRNGLAIPAWLDIAAVALPLGQAIGRWANYINQELYGTVTNLPWGILITDREHRVFPFESPVDFPYETTKFHPLFLYEALWSLVAFIVLLNLFSRNRNKMVPGDLFLIYLMQYSVIRFLLEFLRLEISVVAGFNVSQVVTIVIFIGAAAMFYLRRRNAESAPKRKDLKDRPMPGEKAEEAAA